jgi:UDP-N-acetylmuramate dehydrogenase
MPFDRLLEENKPLAPLTTLGIGGPARWFLEATDEDTVAEASVWARDRGIRLFVLGGGSNLLVADAGVYGLVLHVGLSGISVEESVGGSAQNVYRARAGEDWDRLVQKTVDENCAGLECLAGIPGTVGGTPVQNVGAYGQEVASTIGQVRAFDQIEQAWVEFSAAECGFSYRRSRFNTVDRGRYIVTRVDYWLTPHGTPTLRYADLARTFAGKPRPSLGEVANAVRRIRLLKGMLLVEGDPDCRSAGSFFKNPVITEEHALRLAETVGTQPPRFAVGDAAGSSKLVKIPAAWLIEHAGFAKGYALGAAGISNRHTLALVNRGGASAAEIVALAEKITAEVQSRFGIVLEREPVLLGFCAD